MIEVSDFANAVCRIDAIWVAERRFRTLAAVGKGM